MAVRALSKQQIAYQYVHSKIMDGTFVPGYRIVVDQIVQELSLSPSPIREAIRKLEADGYLENKPYCGVVVISMKDKECLERMQALAVMEGYAASKSALRLTTDDIKHLENLNKQMMECLEIGDFLQAGSIDRQFHDRILSRCENEYLIKSIHKLLEKLNTIRQLNLMFYPLRMKQSIMEHETLLGMIKAKCQPEEIEQYVRQHKMNATAAYKQNLSGASG